MSRAASRCSSMPPPAHDPRRLTAVSICRSGGAAEWLWCARWVIGAELIRPGRVGGGGMVFVARWYRLVQAETHLPSGVKSVCAFRRGVKRGLKARTACLRGCVVVEAGMRSV